MTWHQALSDASQAVLYMILAILYSTLEVILFVNGRSNWIKTVTGLLIFYSTIMLVVEVCWTLYNINGWPSIEDFNYFYWIASFLYYISQWILACKYFQTTNEAINYPSMSSTQLATLNCWHKYFLFFGLIVIFVAILLSWSWANRCTDVYDENDAFKKTYFIGMSLFILPPFIVVMVMALSLYEVFKLVKLRKRAQAQYKVICAHVALLILILVLVTTNQIE